MEPSESTSTQTVSNRLDVRHRVSGQAAAMPPLPAVTKISYKSLKLGKAPKSGVRSQGYVHYRILTEHDHNQLYVVLVANDSSGCFSKEVVPWLKIAYVVENLDRQQAFASKAFKDCFVSKSQNNAGFLAAILRAEGLLQADPDSRHQHRLAGDWSAWQSAMLALAGSAELFQLEEPKPKIQTKAVEASPSTEASNSQAIEDSEQAEDVALAILERVSCDDGEESSGEDDVAEDASGSPALVGQRHGKKPRRNKMEHTASAEASP